jgi:hypothetical protein
MRALPLASVIAIFAMPSRDVNTALASTNESPERGGVGDPLISKFPKLVERN